MEKRQVILISQQPLLGEGLQRIFQKLEEFELVRLDCWDPRAAAACLEGCHPAMVLLAGEKEDDQATHLISYLLKHYEEIPVVWVELETSILRVFTSRSLTGNSAQLLHAIREHEPQAFDIVINEKKSHPGA